MANLFDALRDAARGAYCNTAGPLATGLSILGNIYEGFGGPENADDLRASAQLLRNAQQVACNRLPDDVAPQLAPPFEGGQCPGQSYNVAGTAEVDRKPEFGGGTDTSNFSGTTIGPVRSGGLTVDDPSGPIPFVGFWTAGSPPTSSVGPQPPGVVGTFFGAGVAGTGSLTSQSVSPLPGQTDDCGSLPPSGPPFNPGDWSVPTPVTYDDNNGSPVTINPTFDFGPNKRGPNGGIRVPVSIDLGDGINFDAEFDLETGDITFGPTGTGGPGDDSRPVVSEDPNLSEETVARIIGVRIISTGPGPGNEATEILQSGGKPSLWVPRIGTVSFLYELSATETAWTRDFDIKEADQVVWINRSPTRAVVTPADGWNARIVYLYSLLPCGECC